MNKNLNLLPVFIAIADEQSLSKAAQKLKLTQPALSHALQKLREDFNDPLFVRSSHGMTPTHRALQILPTLRSLLLPLTDCYRDTEEKLTSISRQLTLASTTYIELRILDQLRKTLKTEAPKMSLHCLPLTGEFPKRDLESGILDVAVAAYFRDIPDNMRVKVLSREEHVCIFSLGHPYGKSRNRLKCYLEHEHLVISIPPGAPQKMDEALAERNCERKVTVAISNFMTPPILLTQSDLILTCPKTLAEHYAHQYKLEIAPTPLELPKIEVKMVWHERNHSDPVQKWFRGQIESSIGKPVK